MSEGQINAHVGPKICLFSGGGKLEPSGSNPFPPQMDYVHGSDNFWTSQMAKSFWRDEVNIMIQFNFPEVRSVVAAIKFLYQKQNSRSCRSWCPHRHSSHKNAVMG